MESDKVVGNVCGDDSSAPLNCSFFRRIDHYPSGFWRWFALEEVRILHPLLIGEALLEWVVAHNVALSEEPSNVSKVSFGDIFDEQVSHKWNNTFEVSVSELTSKSEDLHTAIGPPSDGDLVWVNVMVVDHVLNELIDVRSVINFGSLSVAAARTRVPRGLNFL